jgi:tripartite-type tricarboxylate transporter receptor subunit TctC
MTRHQFTCALSAACVSLFAYAAPLSAQDYPSRAIKMVVGFPPGGATDVLARLVGQKVAEAVGQPVLVENRPGASGTIAANYVAKATPDGYTLFFVTSAHTGNATLYSKLPYDTLKDFAPVAAIAASPVVIVSSKYQTLQDFVSDARARPGKLNYGAAGGGGTVVNLAYEAFKAQMKLDLVTVNYKGSAPAMLAAVSGEVDVSFDTIAGAVGHVRSGKLRALGVTSSTRASSLPGVPTVAEAALPGFDVIGWIGVIAPAATPRDITQRLNREFVKGISATDVREKMLSLGLEPVGGTTEEFGRLIETDTKRWGEIIRRLGLKAD